jgi:mannose-1-phosphate guanylyltransferase / mannose-6-phosphate isomerase
VLVTSHNEETDVFAQPVILCGGSGSRLWPLSRSGFPKQFLSLTSDESLFQLATQRLTSLGIKDVHVAKPLIVTGEEHRFLALEQLREVNIELNAALLEPIGKNTAPALTLAAFAALESGRDPVLLVTPADQTITNEKVFTTAMHAAIRQAIDGSIVILGITPDHGATGYGYIQTKQIFEANVFDAEIYDVCRFVEKPDADIAQQYLDAGNYFWNAGIFVLKASTWLGALESYQPDIAEAMRSAWHKRTIEANSSTPFIRPGKKEFMKIPPKSIDYAVMEHCPGGNFPVKMVELDAGWSDLGAWSAVWKSLPKDKDGNACRGDVILKDSRNNLVHAKNRLVSLVGVDDLIVIETKDAVMVSHKLCSENVKDVVDVLNRSGREEQVLHCRVHRPWGWYESIDEGCGFKVKRIQVKPGASLSLQKHHHRSEHWTVVKGVAQIVNGEKKIRLEENQSTFIPLGEIHRLANPGTTALEIIEVQYGSYLGEDDIVRLDDDYGR